MPDLSAYAARFRGHYEYTGWLSAPDETEVLEGTLTATPTFPTLTVSYTTVTGDYTDIEESMEIVVTRAGAPVGRLRVAAGAATSSVIQVNEVSRNRIPLLSGDTIRVLRSFRVRDKLVGATSTFPKDSRVEYVAQNSLVAPLANDGGHYAQRWLGANIDVPFYGSLSKAVDFTSDDADITHAWSVFGPMTATSTAQNPTFTLAQAGTYWVRHTATDENGVPQVKRSVVVLDANPIPCRITGGIGASLGDPWRTQIRTFSGSGIERLPHGGMVLYHEDEVMNGMAGSVGNRVAHRSRVKFVGYLNKRSMSYDYRTGELVFDVLSPLARLANLPGFSQALQQVLSPVNWQQYEPGLTTNALLVYLLRWHTTYAELFDMVLPDYNLAYPDWFVQQSAPVRQLEEVAQAMDATVKADRTGTLLIRNNLNLFGDMLRDAADETFHLTDADILEVEEASQEDEYEVSQLTGLGFAGDAPLMSISGSPAEGSAFETVDRMITGGQSGSELALNERTGRHWQFRNKLKNGLPVWKLALLLTGNYDVLDPAYDEWILVTLNRTVADYVLSITAERFWLESVEVQHDFEISDDGTEIPVKHVRVTLWGETDGAAGETVPVIVSVTPPPDDFEVPELPPPANRDPLWLDGALDLLVVSRTGGSTGMTLSRIANFRTSPTITTESHALNGETLFDYVSSVFQDYPADCFITSGKIYSLTGMATTGVVTPRLTHGLTALNGQIQTERAAAGWFMAVFATAGGVYTSRSLDGGISWSLPTLRGAASYPNSGLTVGTMPPGLWMSSVTPGLCRTSYYDGTNYVIGISTDYGQTFTKERNINLQYGPGPNYWNVGTPAGNIISTYGDDDHYYIAQLYQASAQRGIFVYYWNGSAWELRAPGFVTGFGEPYRHGMARNRDLAIPSNHTNKLLLAGHDNGGTHLEGGGNSITLSEDGGLTWTAHIPRTPYGNYHFAATASDGQLAFYGYFTGLYVTQDWFATTPTLLGITVPIINLRGL